MAYYAYPNEHIEAHRTINVAVLDVGLSYFKSTCVCICLDHTGFKNSPKFYKI